MVNVWGGTETRLYTVRESLVIKIKVGDDPYDGSYDLTDPQSLNRYSYVEDDPVNLTDPTGVTKCFTVTDEDGDRLRCFDDGMPDVVYVDGKLVTDFIAEVHRNQCAKSGMP